jgi:Patatin-like phospholipase
MRHSQRIAWMRQKALLWTIAAISASFAQAASPSPTGQPEMATQEKSGIEVSSGGVSLGSYQGGYLYACALARRDSSAYRILTGASAGAINMLGGLFYCYHKPRPGWTPYKAWLGLGWDDLLQKDLSDGHLFSVAAIEAQLDPILDSLLLPPDTGTPLPKAVWLGFATTRFFPRYLKNGSLSSPKMDEKITVGLQWLPKANRACRDVPGTGGCWRAWTAVNDTLHHRSPQLFLDFGKYGSDGNLIRKHLKDLALASSAFPVAFERHAVQMVLLDAGKSHTAYARIGKVWSDSEFHPLQMDSDTAHVDDSTLAMLRTGDRAYGRWNEAANPTFSDGGLFENEPLNLASKIHRYLLDEGQIPAQVGKISFVSPSHYDKAFTDTSIALIRRSYLDEWYLFYLVRHPEAQDKKEVTRFLEESDICDTTLKMSTTSLPLAGEHFAHFSAFFKKEYRDFDFAVGMRDGFRNSFPNATDKEAMDSSLKLLSAAEEASLRTNLAYLWPLVDRVYRITEKAHQDVRKELAAMKQDASRDSVSERDPRQEILQKMIDSIKKIQGENPHVDQDQKLPEDLFIRVVNGSLERLKGTLKALKQSEKEEASDQFSNFLNGYTAGHLGDKALLRKSMADQIYLGGIDLLEKDELGPQDAFLVPLALYHARALLGLSLGAVPDFHTPYARIDGSNQGFRFLQGIPFGHVPLGFEVGEHFLPQLVVVRHNLNLFGEFGYSWFLLMNLGIGLESSFDMSRLFFWPRADLIFGDILTFGFDFHHRDNRYLQEIGEGWMPTLSIGSRVGFNMFTVMKGSVVGKNSVRAVK